MKTTTPPDLQSRIVNCLQTILEMERDLRSLDLGHMLLKEFNVLRAFLSRIDTVRIEEEDVERIERATENFLEELRLPLGRLKEEAAAQGGFFDRAFERKTDRSVRSDLDDGFPSPSPAEIAFEAEASAREASDPVFSEPFETEPSGQLTDPGVSEGEGAELEGADDDPLVDAGRRFVQ